MLYFILGIFITLIGCLVGSVFYPDAIVFSWMKNQISTLQAIGSLAIASSALVAFFLYKRTTNRHMEEDAFKASTVFLDESIRLLERAYEVFTDKSEHVEPRRNSRLLWLTTARMLVRYENIKKNITVPAHKDIANEHEEYWRFIFYNLLDSNKENFDLNYLQPSGDMYGGDSIARRSIAVIFDFAKWNGPDVLDSIDDKRLYAKRIIPIDQFGIERYLEQYEEYWQEVMEIRENEYPNP